MGSLMKPISYVPQSTRLLDPLREVLRYKHYSFRTEEAFAGWVKFFVRWHTRNAQARHHALDRGGVQPLPTQLRALAALKTFRHHGKALAGTPGVLAVLHTHNRQPKRSQGEPCPGLRIEASASSAFYFYIRSYPWAHFLSGTG